MGGREGEGQGWGSRGRTNSPSRHPAGSHQPNGSKPEPSFSGTPKVSWLRLSTSTIGHRKANHRKIEPKGANITLLLSGAVASARPDCRACKRAAPRPGPPVGPAQRERKAWLMVTPCCSGASGWGWGAAAARRRSGQRTTAFSPPSRQGRHKQPPSSYSNAAQPPARPGGCGKREAFLKVGGKVPGGRGSGSFPRAGRLPAGEGGARGARGRMVQTTVGLSVAGRCADNPELGRTIPSDLLF